SFREQPLSEGLAVFGEVGLTGEIRPVPFGEERVAEAEKHGFRRALIPKANRPRRSGLELIAVDRLVDALDALTSWERPVTAKSVSPDRVWRAGAALLADRRDT